MYTIFWGHAKIGQSFPRLLLPVQIAQYFSVRNFESNRNSLRSREGRNPEIHQRTSAGDKSIQKRGRNIWQNIPNEIQNVESHVLFKKKYKEFLIIN